MMTRHCAIDGCGNPFHTRHGGADLCGTHYMRAKEGRPLVSARERFVRDHPPGPDVGLVPVGGNVRLLVAAVDAVDYARVMRHTWWAGTAAADGTHYPVAEIDGKRVPLGHFVLGLGATGLVTYFDRDPLNCRRANLAACTPSQLAANARIQTREGKSSQYRGVSLNKRVGRYMAYVKHGGRRYHLGYFADEREAARARDAKAKDLFGPFARLNFPDGDTPRP